MCATDTQYMPAHTLTHTVQTHIHTHKNTHTRAHTHTVPVILSYQPIGKIPPGNDVEWSSVQSAHCARV